MRMRSNGLDTSAKRRQLYQIIVWHRLQRLPGFTPRCQSADDGERVESSFPQHERHPGARSFARSSAVEINLFVLGKMFQFFLEIVGLNAY
jgi:hypothetical protein